MYKLIETRLIEGTLCDVLVAPSGWFQVRALDGATPGLSAFGTCPDTTAQALAEALYGIAKLGTEQPQELFQNYRANVRLCRRMLPGMEGL